MQNNFKHCKKCGEVKPLTEFGKDKTTVDGKSFYCKACRRQLSLQHYYSNEESERLLRKKYYAQNKESINRSRRKHKTISGRGRCNQINPCGYDFGKSKRKAFGESSFERLFRAYKFSAKKRGLVFTLTKAEFKWFTKQNCCYCGLSPEQKAESKDSYGFIFIMD